jgi:hypothetical protein
VGAWVVLGNGDAERGRGVREGMGGVKSRTREFEKSEEDNQPAMKKDRRRKEKGGTAPNIPVRTSSLSLSVSSLARTSTDADTPTTDKQSLLNQALSSTNDLASLREPKTSRLDFDTALHDISELQRIIHSELQKKSSLSENSSPHLHHPRAPTRRARHTPSSRRDSPHGIESGSDTSLDTSKTPTPSHSPVPTCPQSQSILSKLRTIQSRSAGLKSRLGDLSQRHEASLIIVEPKSKVEGRGGMGRDIWTARVESNESLSSLESARSMQDESDVWGEIGEEGGLKRGEAVKG